MTQRMIEITSPNFIREEQLGEDSDLSGFFGAPRPLALEIGCGTGHFALEWARKNPATNLLAIDIYNQGCFKTCRKADEAQLDNLRVMRLEARYLLSRVLGPGSLAAVFVNCPDPWPKKRHRRRRLVNKDFLDLLLYSLGPSGDFFFSTDFANYAHEVADLLQSHKGFANCLASPYTTTLPGYPLSKYMRRFLDKGQPIHFMHYRKQKGVDIDSPPEVCRGFRVRWDKAGNE
ncbi:tRNA (guanosine(46)-N7)-methyltransferase TrmB [uncultured Desulfuromonas sp.]|uniref:tRNA (guanosine(46)-N7)-methyltransferase TrmB n=1 Tax=uncultured Desulfuromonas sp. TaxID=181013 RepID=UPI002630DB21|nr:tRNA (guanosine(46)-N7)-methyltransferase TrmB [uncultured Desulfuromonas sp.]